MAPGRAARPKDVGAPPGAHACAFCPGAEDQTPPEVDAVRAPGTTPDTPGWLVRVVPNKYPALPPEEGRHEVLISSPEHLTSLGGLDDAQAALAAGVWARRVAAAEADPRRLRPFLFLNQGREAGASLQHVHTQLVGLPFDPPRLAARDAAFAAAPACPVCADVAAAQAEGRLVAAPGDLVCWLPRVPAFSAGIRLAPAAHTGRWHDGPDPGRVGPAARDLVARIGAALGLEALNLWLHEARPGDGGGYHWHLDVVPRLGVLAGLELGAGVLAGAHDPAALAARLREVPAPAHA